MTVCMLIRNDFWDAMELQQKRTTSVLNLDTSKVKKFETNFASKRTNFVDRMSGKEPNLEKSFRMICQFEVIVG